MNPQHGPRRRFHPSAALWTAFGFALAAVASVGAAASRPTAPRVAYVSVQRVLAQSPAAAAAARQIQQFRDERAKEIADKQKALEALRLKVAQSGGMFQGTKKAEAQQEEARALADLQRLQQESQTQLQNMQRDAQRDFQRDLTAVVGELAAQRGADLVLNPDTAVVWSQGGMDWTEDVARGVIARQSADKKQKDGK